MGGGQSLTDGGGHAVKIVLGMLKGKAGRQRGTVGQSGVHDSVGIFRDRLGHGAAVTGICDEGADRQSAEVQAEGVEGGSEHDGLLLQIQDTRYKIRDTRYEIRDTIGNGFFFDYTMLGGRCQVLPKQKTPWGSWRFYVAGDLDSTAYGGTLATRYILYLFVRHS
jgi:hypothetical protein